LAPVTAPPDLPTTDQAGLPELSAQYTDYAAWQRESLSQGVLDEQLRYWRERLAGAPPLLELPTDRQRPAVPSYRGDRVAIRVSSGLVADLQSLCHRTNSTMFMALFAAFALQIAHLSERTDIIVGTPVANRNREELEHLIGFFVNTVVLRVDLAGNPTVDQLMARVKEAAVGAYAHQDAPFERVVEQLSPPRTRRYAPVFQVMFMMQKPVEAPVELPGLRWEHVEIDPGVAKVDLSVSLQENGDEITGCMEFSTDLFDPDTVRAMADEYVRVLEKLVEGSTVAHHR